MYWRPGWFVILSILQLNGMVMKLSTFDGLGSHTANCGDNSPIISTCPTNIKTFEGYSAGDLFTAYDEDGIVTNASTITEVSIRN